MEKTLTKKYLIIRCKTTDIAEWGFACQEDIPALGQKPTGPTLVGFQIHISNIGCVNEATFYIGGSNHFVGRFFFDYGRSSVNAVNCVKAQLADGSDRPAHTPNSSKF